MELRPKFYLEIIYFFIITYKVYFVCEYMSDSKEKRFNNYDK